MCAIVFCLFIFLYIFSFQTDLLAYAQHIWSGGQTHWNGLIGASILTVVLLIIQLGIASVIRVPVNFYSLSFVPSLLMLGALTSVSPQDNGMMSVGIWAWITFILLVVYAFAVRFVKGSFSYSSASIQKSPFLSSLLINLIIMLGMFLLVMGIGNTDAKLHYRLRVERLVDEKKYNEALSYIKKEGRDNPALTMWCAYSLSQTDRLGEELFEYNVRGGSACLLPTSSANCGFTFTPDSNMWRHLGGIPREMITDTKDFLYSLQRHKVARKPVKHYLLSAYLLDCDLIGFAKEIQKQYNIISDTLPKHYREALVLYTHSHSQRVLTYHSSVLDADYADFLALSRKKYVSEEERKNVLRESYFGTYWYYYEANKRH